MEKLSSEIYDFLESVISAVIFVAIVLVFFVRVAVVDGESMIPTLQDTDKLIISDFSKDYEHGDVVVIHQEDGVTLVKRIIATGGDVVDIDFERGVVSVNGTELDEPYTAEPTYLNYGDGQEYPLTIPEGYLFCMGDNRNHSLDSRSNLIGLIDEQYIIGKMVLDLNNKEAK
ncbi:MAG: signal peptidase I [Clostridia bacterium]|nr:signal peptidase I [Clostridia bacterium]